MKRRSPVLALFALVALLTSCSTEVELNSSWKEKMVIYALLDQGKTEQYVNITKAFLGEGDASLMAQEPDSLYYKAGEITVTLERIKNGSVTSTEVLQRVTTDKKEAGVFTNQNTVLYKAVNKLFSDSEYRIKVVNNNTGYTATAKTVLINDNNGTYNLSRLFPIVSFRTNSGQYVNEFKVQFDPTANGKLYQVKARFNFWEKASITAKDSVAKYVDWVFPVVKYDASMGTPVTQVVDGSQFYKFLKAQIPVADVVRVAGTLDFSILVGGEDLAVYSEVSKPTSSINQEKPVYTNVENGLGVFSCRYETKALPRQINYFSMQELYFGEYTAALNFRSATY